MQSFHRKSAGFTLVEIMITVAIIGILAALAIPQYQNYTRRARIAEGLVLASAIKAAIAETYAALGPGNIEAETYTYPGNKNVSQITVTPSGQIMIYNPASLLGMPGTSAMTGMSLIPVNDGVLYSLADDGNTAWSGQWKCTSSFSTSNALMPAACRT